MHQPVYLFRPYLLYNSHANYSPDIVYRIIFMVIFYADDLGYNDTSAYGSKLIPTPTATDYRGGCLSRYWTSQNVQVERAGGARCNRTSAYSSEEDRHITRRCDTTHLKREETVQTHNNSYETAIPGMIKNAEGKINGKTTYARITIRRKQRK